MSNRQPTKAHVLTGEWDTAVEKGRGSGRTPYVRLPFHFVVPAVFGFDLVLVIALSLLANVGYHWTFLGQASSIGPYVGIGVLAFSNFSAILAARGDYRVSNLINFRRQAKDVALVWTGVLVILLVIAFLIKVSENYSRGATIVFYAFGLVSLVAWRGVLARILVKALASGTFAERKVIVIGEQSRLASSRVLSELRRCGYTPVTVFEIDKSESIASGTPQTLRNSLDVVIETARNDFIENIVLMMGWDNSRCIDDILKVLSVLPLPVHLIPDENVARYLSRRMVHLGTTWTAELRRAPLSKAEQALKRSVDVLGAGVGLLLLSPLMLVTAFLIKLDSSGPTLFTQRRNGFNGCSFRIFKFRTMTVLEDGAIIQQAKRDDPRVTRLGRWLRRSNIDELPQLFNVLRGEMSLVGPRPHAAAHNSEYERKIAAYAFRYNVKPGITGWAQVNGHRGETRTVDSMAKRVELDLRYIDNWSIWFDIKILIRTIIIGFRDPTAY